MNNLLFWIKNLFGYGTTADITADFDTKVQQLKQLAETANQRALRDDQRAIQLQREAEGKRKEAIKAGAVAAKINALLS